MDYEHIKQNTTASGDCGMDNTYWYYFENTLYVEARAEDRDVYPLDLWSGSIFEIVEDIEKAIYSATKTMCEVLQKHLGYNLNKAGMLTSLVGNLQFCQVVDPALTVRMAVPKTICDKII